MDKSFFLDDPTTSIGFFGIGKSNLSLISALPSGRRITLRSDKTIDRTKIPHHVRVENVYEGESALSDIREEVLVLSPSARRDRPELSEAVLRGVTLTSDCELFFSKVSAPVLAVSGSAGKSTTATLAHLMLGGKDGGYRLVGNVGVPMLHSIDGEAMGYVAELSSFMLEYYTPRTRRYALTNITPNHLDFHSSFEEYKEAKLRPLNLSDGGIICADDETLSRETYRHLFAVYSTRLSISALATRYRAEVYFTLDSGYICRNGERVLSADGPQYKMLNTMCALAMVDGISDKDEALEAARSFKNLSHRCDTVYSKNGVDFIDSSIDTTPDRCATTLTSLGRQVVLLLGGRGKGLSYDVMLPPVLKYARFAVLFGEESERIFSLLSGKVECAVCPDFADAVRLAASVAKNGEAVLLSPACTSYDAFSDYEERARAFCSIVRSL